MTKIASKNAQTEARYNSIDFAKGICILFVIVTHFAWQEGEELKYLFPFWIDMAVPIFMIISGYVYTKSFQRNNIVSLFDAYTVRNCLRRIVKYTIPFLFAFIFEEIVFSMTSEKSHTVMNIIFGFLNGGYGPGSYYYPIMLQFVFYFPIIYMIVKKYDFMGVIWCGVINFVYEVLKTSYGMNEACYRLLLFRYTLLIAYGCYLAMGNYKRHKVLSVICVMAGSAYLVATVYMDVKPVITNYWTSTSFLASLFIIPLSAPLILNKAKNIIIETIGKASYDIFLVQMIYYHGIGQIHTSVENKWLQLLVIMGVCVFVGVVFYYIETPITKVVSKMIGKMCDRNAAAKNENDNVPQVK